MLSHRLGHYPTCFHLDGEIPPSYGYGTFASRLERMHARGDTCKNLYIPTSHHTHTHMLGAHASFHLIPMFSWSSSGETLISVHTRIFSPPDVPLTWDDRRRSLLLCVCLGHRVMSNHVGSQIGALSYPVSS